MLKRLSMGWLVACLAVSFLSLPTAAQNDQTNLEKVQTVGGFLEVCTPNREKPVNHILCLGYLTGLVGGWKEGRHYGVLNAYLPNGIPDDLQEAVKGLSDEDLETLNAAIKNEPFCLPDRMTYGDLVEVVAAQFRIQVARNPLFGLSLTSRLFHTALRDTYPCK
jgi:hypothetical protein